MIVRSASLDDAAAVAAIYGHHVLHSLGTFEETPPSVAEIAGRMEAVLSRGLPYLVAEDAGRVLGFAYAGPFRPRAAYRYTAEDSVYIAPDQMGRGVGKALLGQVIAACEAMGLRQLLAVIGDSGNAGSIALHRSLGFQDRGIGRAVGFKHGRWLDIVTLQRPLNDGAASLPTGPGLGGT
ncbi:MAG TPA: GNAT family N-acetyltransferase [Caulobacteraceae bacterium]|nr:GNAT family N-acetyltransferase [Caulobacteraceae bacterium]